MRVQCPRARLSRRALVVISLALLGASPLPGLAQAGPPVVIGATVRAKARGPRARWEQGEVIALTTDSVMIQPRWSRDTVALATRTLAQFQISQGRSARTGKGALLGLGIGAGAGLLLGLVAWADYHCTGFCEINLGPEDVLALTALGGGLGAGVGALIGAALRGERWQPVGASHRAGRHAPMVQGTALGLRISF